ncbi:MAG: hypothetical protein VCD00_19915 [Candidatus Hydrogenedentota bacterium]
MKRMTWLSAIAVVFAATSAQAQLPPDAVKLDRVKIAEKIKPENFCPVHNEYAESPVSTWEHAGVTYGGNKAECADLFAKDADGFHAKAEQARWELNFVHSMSPIWCPVTDEISPGGNTKWEVIGLTWESCCQFCNDTKTDEDFPRALKVLQARAAKAFGLQGNKYVNDASSPVQGAIDLGGGLPPLEDDKSEFEPAWLVGQDLEATWSGGIGKIAENRCFDCHRAGGAAPMPLQTLGAMKKWSKNTKTHITAGTMPPWPGKPGMSFANAKNLTTNERDLFVSWIEAGYPAGDGEFTPSREWGDSAIGTPDAVIALGEFTLGEDVADLVKEFDVKTDFDSDKWVVATEVTPTDTFLSLEINGGALGSYHRGNTTNFLPEGTGYLIKKGESIKVRVFYTKEAGWEEFDTDTKFALKFADGAQKQLIQERLANDDFTIPAGKEAATASATFTFPSDGEIVSFNPVLRQRGKSITVTATTPGGSAEELVVIPRWDTNWHFNYTLVEPFTAPKGTTVTVTATYDNSELNAMNPDASVDAKAGPGGDLLEGWMTYTLNDMKSAQNRFGLTDEQLMATTGTCSKCAAAKAVTTD